MMRTMVRTCEYCGEECDSPAKYASHKRFEHPGWREGLVPLLAEANGTVETEPDTQSLPNVYTCPHCQEGFATKYRLQKHVNIRHGRDTGPADQPTEEQAEETAEEATAFRLAYCPSCGLSIDRLQQVLHSIEVGLSYCPGCGLDVVKVRRALEG